MSKTSEYVKTWRKALKARIVEAMGGKCAICSYDRCNNALQLHHIDPTQKDFTIGQARATPMRWSAIVTELRKCVLLCNRCHEEVHDGLASVPSDYVRFDERFENYQTLMQKAVDKPCPVCGKAVPEENVHCSRQCAGISKNRINWSALDLPALFEEFGTRDVVARHLGVSRLTLSRQTREKRLCFTCGNSGLATGKNFCSVSCSGKARRKVDWAAALTEYNIGGVSRAAIARKYGVSEAAVRKRLKYETAKAAS